MKLLSDFQDSSMSMVASSRLKALLGKMLSEERVSHIFESGTFQGLGSTKFVAESFAMDRPPEQFVTVEANWMSWRSAKENLRRFPFVQSLWGRTVAVDKALQFLESDDALHEHYKYPDIFIDNTEAPFKFYTDEVRGNLGGSPKNPGKIMRQALDQIFSYAGDNLLEKYLRSFQNLNPLVVLDSAGGVGFLEFSIVKDVMKSCPYLILLDDINHIKHFRSYQYIRDNPYFTILGVDEKEGWLLAKHFPE